MKSSKFIFSIVILFSLSWKMSLADHHNNTNEKFVRCLYSNDDTSNRDFIFTPTLDQESYFSALNFSIRNPRFASPATPKPVVIVAPSEVSQVQRAVVCSKRTGLEIRVRSGGHDYEGLSYVSEAPFFILDLINIRSVRVDASSRTAWIESGATIGDVYYRIAEKSLTLGFPAGVCHTVGVGGHFSGGGYGTLLRKYGLAADNVMDALVIDAEGRALDRASMGEDFFWAIRGGGGASFGVVLAWRVNLVPVPETVTVFTLDKNLAQNATELIHRWQFVAHKFDRDLFVRLVIQAVNSATDARTKTVQVSFNSLFLGRADRLLELMGREFPELGLTREDCVEMSWIESILYFDGVRGQPREVLLDRVPENILSFKAKSDYITNPISVQGLEGIWERLYEEEVGRGILIMSPYGGRMEEIPESEIPFPHRIGNLYKIQYLIYWVEQGNAAQAESKIDWIRRLYSYMTPYVSQNPRSAYLNYRDLDVGTNSEKGLTSYAEARVFGTKYFKNNFERLVRVKTRVDPNNFFRNEQSIPSLSSLWSKRGH